MVVAVVPAVEQRPIVEPPSCIPRMNRPQRLQPPVGQTAAEEPVVSDEVEHLKYQDRHHALSPQEYRRASPDHEHGAGVDSGSGRTVSNKAIGRERSPQNCRSASLVAPCVAKLSCERAADEVVGALAA